MDISTIKVKWSFAGQLSSKKSQSFYQNNIVIGNMTEHHKLFVNTTTVVNQ